MAGADAQANETARECGACPLASGTALLHMS
jgi:hypothetical protein